MRHTAWLSLLALVGAVQNAAADDGDEHTHTILPSLKLEGGKGKTALEIGLDIAIGLERLRDLRITPTFKATATDGISTILSTDGAAFSPGGAWQLGIAGALSDLPNLTGISSEVVPREVRVAAVETCRAECDTNQSTAVVCEKWKKRRHELNPRLAELEDAAKHVEEAVSVKEKAENARNASRDEDKRLAADVTATKEQKDAAIRDFTAKEAAVKKAAADETVAREAAAKMGVEALSAALHEHDAKIVTEFVGSIDPLELCTKGREPYLKEERDASLQLPRRVWSAGILIGQTRLKWLDPTAADPMLFTPSKPKYYPQVTLAGSYLAIDTSSSFTREYSFRFDSTRAASQTTAKWCVPGGMVQRPDGSGADPAQICDELPVGPPKAVRTLRAAAYFGAIDRHSTAWRFAVGPTLKYTPVSKADGIFEVSAETPVYVRMSVIKQSLSAIVKLTPTFTLTHASNGTEETKFTLTLAILGDRSMFPNALE